MELQGSVAIVTGGAKRVGKSIALALAKRGVSIVLHYNHSEEEAIQTARLIEAEGVKSFCLKANLSKVSEIEKFIAEAMTAAGRIDILINSASQFKETPFENISEADWNSHLDTNLKGPFFFLSLLVSLCWRSARGRSSISSTPISPGRTCIICRILSRRRD